MRGTDDVETVFLNSSGKKEWPCRYCLVNYQLSGGTENIGAHLRKHHGVHEDSPADIRIKNLETSIAAAMEGASANPQKRRRLNQEEAITDLNPDVLELLYVQFIAVCNQSLRLAECPEFRAFLFYLNKDIDTWLPSDNHTIHKWVMRQWEAEKVKKKQRLQSARSKIHITTDMWTSTNDLAMMAVVAQFLGEDNQLETILLALKSVEGSHEGENLAKYLMEVVEDWGFANNLGYLVMDNASSNDTLIRYFSIGK
jgi:hypothetical protein